MNFSARWDDSDESNGNDPNDLPVLLVTPICFEGSVQSILTLHGMDIELHSTPVQLNHCAEIVHGNYGPSGVVWTTGTPLTFKPAVSDFRRPSEISSNI